MFACVQYAQDRKRALLPISLIKNFQPNTSRDFSKQKTVSAYWRGEDGEGEGYYSAHVTALADSLQELTTALRTSRSPLPRLITGSASNSAVAPKGVSEKEKRKRKREAARNELGNILSSFKEHENAETHQELPEEVTKSATPNPDLPSFSEPSEAPADAIIRALREEVETLKKELEAERAHSRRLSEALLEKIEIAREAASNASNERALITEYFVPEVAPSGMFPIVFSQAVGLSLM